VRAESQVFSGRIVFDHLPKTAGQAVNAWLFKALGSGSVTSNLIGRHRELIRNYGGEYPVISAHVEFEGNGFDPRYQYLTCVREPLDRALSWIYFVLKNHDAVLLPGLWDQVSRFVELDGSVPDMEAFDLLVPYINNPYVSHFSKITGHTFRTDAERIDVAIENIRQYDVWGLYERLPDFLAAVASIVGVPAPTHLRQVNVTRSRPKADAISSGLREKLGKYNQLDLEFYRRLMEIWSAEQDYREFDCDLSAIIAPYNRPPAYEYDAEEFSLISVDFDDSLIHLSGQLIKFDIFFCSCNANAKDLELILEIRDERGGLASSINCADLGMRLSRLMDGTHRLRGHLAANFPEGLYYASLSVIGSGIGELAPLARYEGIFKFYIEIPRLGTESGYVSADLNIDCIAINDALITEISDAAGDIRSEVNIGQVVVGETWGLPVTVRNGSDQTWRGTYRNPILLECGRRDGKGNLIVEPDGQTRLPGAGLEPGESIEVLLNLIAPDVPGRYEFEICLRQIGRCRFDSLGFELRKLLVDVVEDSGEREYLASDTRLLTQCGKRAAGEIVSTGQAGYLLFGPYVELRSGSYTATLIGTIESDGCGMTIDVCAHQGTTVFARKDMVDVGLDGRLVSVDFELPEVVSGVEVRLWVAEASRIQVHALHIARAGAHERRTMEGNLE